MGVLGPEIRNRSYTRPRTRLRDLLQRRHSRKQARQRTHAAKTTDGKQRLSYNRKNSGVHLASATRRKVVFGVEPKKLPKQRVAEYTTMLCKKWKSGLEQEGFCPVPEARRRGASRRLAVLPEFHRGLNRHRATAHLLPRKSNRRGAWWTSLRVQLERRH